MGCSARCPAGGELWIFRHPVRPRVPSRTDAITALPGLITKANIGQALAAPALKKIEKTVRMDVQYFPSAAINLDSAEFSESGSGSIRVDASVDIFVFAADSKADRLSTFIDRYLDAVCDLASSAALFGSAGFNVKVVHADKGIEPDGARGWAAVQFIVWGEALF